MKKALILIICIVCMSFSITSYAAHQEITPFYNNTSSATLNFVINENGEASITVKYIGFWNSVTRASISTTLQKKELDGEWIDLANWNDESTTTTFSNAYSYQLSDHGEYRVIAEYTIFGTRGEPDAIEKTIEKIY